MFGSEVLDTAIGLVFVFLLVSMLVTMGNELISAALLSRAKWLRYGMVRLLGSAWAQKLYDHPLIEGTGPLTQPTTVAPSDGKLTIRGSGPSYISSRAFTDVLLHLVQGEDLLLRKVIADVRAVLNKADDLQGGAAALHGAVLAAATAAVGEQAGSTIVSDLARFLSDRKDAFVVGLLGDMQQRLRQADGKTLVDPQNQLATLLGTFKDLKPGELEARLTQAIRALPAANDLVIRDLGVMVDRLHTGYTIGNAVADIGRFVDAMPVRYLQESIDRLPNEKVKRTLHVLLDDAQQDVEHFKQNVEIWFNNAMDRVSGWYKRRSQWVVGGLGLVAAIGLNVDSMAIVDYLQTHASVRDALIAKAKGYSDPGQLAADPDEAAQQFADVQGELTGLGLPVGWSLEPLASDPYKLEFDTSTLGSAIRFHLLGWLITALASTLGAPFWFDTLNRIISIRSAGKSPEEKPRAPKTVSLPLEPGQTPLQAATLDAVRGDR